MEDRIVVPIDDEHRACEVLGLWASLHLSHSARIDGGINAALAWLSLTGGSVMQPALGVPIRVWANLRFPWFVGLIGSAHVFGATAYTSSYLKVTTGLAFGYRLGRCDIMQSTVAMDALRNFTGLLSSTLLPSSSDSPPRSSSAVDVPAPVCPALQIRARGCGNCSSFEKKTRSDHVCHTVLLNQDPPILHASAHTRTRHAVAGGLLS